MAPVNDQPIGVFCVDDNENVAEALRIKLGRSGQFRWMGWLASADRLVESVECSHPDVVLLDVDMPGRNPFEALAELLERCPDTRAIVFSGHSSKDLVDQAVEAGAWVPLRCEVPTRPALGTANADS